MTVWPGYDIIEVNREKDWRENRDEMMEGAKSICFFRQYRRVLNKCEKKLKKIIVKCKDVGMSKRDVEEMIDRVVDEVFGEE